MLRAIRDGNFSNLGDELTSVNLENVERTVKTVLDEVDQRRRDMLAQTPLDDARIEQFDRTLRELLVDGSRPRLAKIIVDGATSGTARKIGYRRRLNKWYFVESDVIAEPDRLARNVAGDLIHQEEQAILSTILEAAPAYEAAAESIPDKLPDWLTGTEESRLIVTNSWNAFFQLIPFEQLEGLTCGDLLETASRVPVFRVTMIGRNMLQHFSRHAALVANSHSRRMRQRSRVASSKTAPSWLACGNSLNPR